MGGKRLWCPIRFSSKKEDLIVRSYLYWRIEHGYRGYMFFQGPLKMAMEGKQPPVIAKVHLRNDLGEYDVRKIAIMQTHPYYEQMCGFNTSLRTHIIKNTLYSCIKMAAEDEDEWFMSELDIAKMLSVGEEADNIRQTINIQDEVQSFSREVIPVKEETVITEKDNMDIVLVTPTKLPQEKEKKKRRKVSFGGNDFKQCN